MLPTLLAGTEHPAERLQPRRLTVRRVRDGSVQARTPGAVIVGATARAVSVRRRQVVERGDDPVAG